VLLLPAGTRAWRRRSGPRTRGSALRGRLAGAAPPPRNRHGGGAQELRTGHGPVRVRLV